MKNVLRNDSNQIDEITHIAVFFENGSNVYLSKADYRKYTTYTITEDDIRDFYGEDNLYKELVKIANSEYPINILKFDIMKYCNRFEDKIIKL